MSLRDYVRILRKRFVAALLVFLAVVSGTVLFTSTQPPVYQTTSEVYIVMSGVGSDINSAQTGFSFVSSRLSSYALLVNRPAVLDQASRAAGFTISSSQVSATVQPGTQLIDITATDGNAKRAALIANSIADELGVVIDDFETPLAASGQQVTTRLVQRAETPDAPISPRPNVNYAIGILLGLAGALLIALALEGLDQTVTTPEQIQELTGASPIGIISLDKDAGRTPLVALNRKSPRSEGFRTIRTNLQFVDVDNPPRVIVVTSSVPREGKTTSALNLAVTIAYAEQRVLLIEADLRRPRASEYAGIDGSVGLTSVLSGQTRVEEALVPWHRGLMTILPSGPIPPNPSELLASDHMRALLTQLKTTFDVIIIDAPPLLPVADAAILSGIADGAIFITRWGRTRREQVTASLEQLHTVGARLLGTVVNFAPGGRRGYNYGYGYHYGYRAYGYGSGYGYSDKEKRKHKIKDIPDLTA